MLCEAFDYAKYARRYMRTNMHFVAFRNAFRLSRTFKLLKNLFVYAIERSESSIMLVMMEFLVVLYREYFKWHI